MIVLGTNIAAKTCNIAKLLDAKIELNQTKKTGYLNRQSIQFVRKIWKKNGNANYW